MVLKLFPKVYPEVPNWWYHYYSVALGKKIRQISPRCFLLHPHKSTPDFRNYTYNYGICHFQIGQNIVPGKSIVVLRTTIGLRNAPIGSIEKSPFITGYFRVCSVNKDKQIIIMEKEDSLLLLDNPITINMNWAKKLFPEKPEEYWLPLDSFVQKIGSITRNRQIKERELILVLKELYKRKNEGSENYLGRKYGNLHFP